MLDIIAIQKFSPDSRIRVNLSLHCRPDRTNKSSVEVEPGQNAQPRNAIIDTAITVMIIGNSFFSVIAINLHLLIFNIFLIASVMFSQFSNKLI